MKIAIDCSKAVNELAGIAKYTEELTKNLINFYPEDEYFLYFNFIRNAESKIKRIEFIINKKKNVNYHIYKIPGWIKERVYHSSYPISNNWVRESEVIHATEFLSFDNGLKKPQILTVHDLTMIKFPSHRGIESIRHGKMLRKACQNANKIIAISKATKNDIIKYFSINEDKITVIYNGKSNIFKPLKNIEDEKKYLQNKYQIDFPFIFFVGTIEPRKNISSLLKAFDKLVEKYPNHYLVLAGKKGWNSDDIYDSYKKLKNKKFAKFVDFVETEDLPLFYGCAELFCYPSLYEGFGLPILEAMACGVPVLTSNISSMPEVGGDAVSYADPNSSEDIFNKMDKIISDKYLQQKMKKLGLEQAEKFSWRKCAKETHKIYEEVLKDAKKS